MPFFSKNENLLEICLHSNIENSYLIWMPSHRELTKYDLFFFFFFFFRRQRRLKTKYLTGLLFSSWLCVPNFLTSVVFGLFFGWGTNENTPRWMEKYMQNSPKPSSRRFDRTYQRRELTFSYSTYLGGGLVMKFVAFYQVIFTRRACLNKHGKHSKSDSDRLIPLRN